MASPDASVTRPITVVTGGSEGIGRAFARRLAERGDDLLIIARGAERLSAVAEEIRKLHPVTVETLALDVTHADALAQLDAALARLCRHVGLLVNNAGIGLSGPLHGQDRADVERLIALNMTAPTLWLRHVLGPMRARRAGGVITMSSLGGFGPGPNQAAYHASRAYLLSLCEAVASEVAADGVRITVVAPGPVNTRFHAKMDADTAFYRKLIPALSADTVARWGLRGYALGMRVVVPGVFNNVLAISLRILPHRLVVPIEGWLYRPRR